MNERGCQYVHSNARNRLALKYCQCHQQKNVEIAYGWILTLILKSVCWHCLYQCHALKSASLLSIISVLNCGYMRNKHWNNVKIISVFYSTRNQVWNWHKIISAAVRVLNLFRNYFSDIEHVGKYSRAAINLWNNFEIISGKFPHAEIKLFQMDVMYEGWNNFEILLFYM